jgi:Arc/MetJ-type ribon-helix-helix transcriptional regulator
MADAPNGLASMTQARERRVRRTMPPPRHPVPAGSAEPVQPEPDQPPEQDSAEPHPAAVIPRAGAADSVKKTERAVRVAVQPTAEAVKPSGEDAPRPATLYLDNNLLEFLEQARIAGLVGRPRLDISKSAVVRLALRRLQQEMTIQEIRDHLGAQPTDPTKTGRKRR